MLLDKGWDVVVCLTDLPLHVEQRPVVAHANPVRNVAIVSVPALGAMGARQRIREMIGRLLVRLIGSPEQRGADAQRLEPAVATGDRAAGARTGQRPGR